LEKSSWEVVEDQKLCRGEVNAGRACLQSAFLTASSANAYNETAHNFYRNNDDLPRLSQVTDDF